MFNNRDFRVSSRLSSGDSEVETFGSSFGGGGGCGSPCGSSGGSSGSFYSKKFSEVCLSFLYFSLRVENESSCQFPDKISAATCRIRRILPQIRVLRNQIIASCTTKFFVLSSFRIQRKQIGSSSNRNRRILPSFRVQ